MVFASRLSLPEEKTYTGLGIQDLPHRFPLRGIIREAELKIGAP